MPSISINYKVYTIFHYLHFFLLFLLTIILNYVINEKCLFFIFRDVSTSRAPIIDTSTTSIKAKAGEGCPRCGGVVFAAEQVLAKGSVSNNYCQYQAMVV